MVVALTRGETHAHERVFRGDGSISRILDLRNGARGSEPNSAFLRVANVDGLAVRIRPQAQRPGEVVQDANDGEYGGVRVSEDASGTRRVEQLGMLLDKQIRESEALHSQSFFNLRGQPTEFPAALANNTTFVRGLVVIDGSDWGSSSDPMELRWFAKHRRRSDDFLFKSTSVTFSAPSNYYDTLNLAVIDRVQSPGAYIWIKFAEDDGGWGLEMEHEYLLEDETDNFISRIWWFPRRGAGGWRCNAPAGWSCPIEGYGFYSDWAEVNYNLAWQPYSAPSGGGSAASFSGPQTVWSDGSGSWSATNVLGPTPHYFEWKLDGGVVGNSSTLNTWIGAPGTAHMLEMSVVDSTGYWQGYATQINVSTCDVGPPECYESLRQGSLLNPQSTRAKPTKKRY